ncbi:MAG: hypothetical protein MO852_17685, partial [Candidatus Devosia euplotis]|nr:hypothetical protein [Candidatus Devosia euplotis]
MESLAADLAASRDFWWIFGGAAMALHCLETDAVQDIDVLMSLADADALMERHRLTNTAGNADQFRSEIFLHPVYGMVPVEIMAGFQVKSAGARHTIRPQTRDSITLATGMVHAPSHVELAEIFRLFGRPKDLVKALLL